MTSDPSLERLDIDETTLRPYGTMVEVTNAVGWLYPDSASFVHGENMGIDGGARSK